MSRVSIGVFEVVTKRNLLERGNLAGHRPDKGKRISKVSKIDSFIIPRRFF